jgi:hypothetical protein
MRAYVYVYLCRPISSPSQPWLYLSTATSYDCAALQPLPAPAAAPVAPFNPHIPVQVDVDALLAAVRDPAAADPTASSSSSLGGGQQAEVHAAAPFNPYNPREAELAALLSADRATSSMAGVQQQRRRLQQQLVCGGMQLPAAAAEAVLQGGISRSLLMLQRTPHVACQVLLGGERLLYAVPLVLFAGEPVRLVLLLELVTTPGSPAGVSTAHSAVSSNSSTAGAAGSSGGGVAGSASDQQQQPGVLYCGRRVVPFADVYPAMRALGPVDWVRWVVDAVLELRVQQR